MNNDRVNEAYEGAFGENFAVETRERCDWIVGKARASRILDVGCSQGINSILLAKEGAEVTGIDVELPSVEYARKAVEPFKDSLVTNPEFLNIDFLLYDAEGKKFNCVVMTEVLEHVEDPEQFVEKAVSLLDDRGRLVVTVPFGINPFPDHKRTYYCFDLYSLLNQYIRVVEMKFFDMWVGFVCEKMPGSKAVVINDEFVRRFEAAVAKLDERRMLEFDNQRITCNKTAVQLSESQKYCANLEKQLSEFQERCSVFERRLSESQKYCANLEFRLSESEKLGANLKAGLEESQKRASAYRREYMRLVNSRGIKIWAQLRRLVGRKPYQSPFDD